NGMNGYYPIGTLLEDSNGNLFGTTSLGGSGSAGTVFEVAAGSGTITTLAYFNGTNGANPNAGLVEDSSGNLFGTATAGGTSNVGRVFELAVGSGTITPLASFRYSDGANPYGGLVQDRSGNLFGTTHQGGPTTANAGPVFELGAFNRPDSPA